MRTSCKKSGDFDNNEKGICVRYTDGSRLGCFTESTVDDAPATASYTISTAI